MEKPLYSIRMRAAEGGSHEAGGRHISGAERMVTKEELSLVAAQMVNRALSHPKGKVDFIQVVVDSVLPENIQKLPMANIRATLLANKEEGHCVAQNLLASHTLVTQEAVDRAIHMVFSRTDTMRGAMLINALTGERMDTTGDRGVRVTRMSFHNPQMATQCMETHGYRGEHIQEAIVLATKVLSAPGIVGELCISDDPDYVIGYVSYEHTYHRISIMKDMHSPLGGRAFFVAPGTNIEHLTRYLEGQAVLVTLPEKWV